MWKWCGANETHDTCKLHVLRFACPTHQHLLSIRALERRFRIHTEVEHANSDRPSLEMVLPSATESTLSGQHCRGLGEGAPAAGNSSSQARESRGTVARPHLQSQFDLTTATRPKGSLFGQGFKAFHGSLDSPRQPLRGISIYSAHLCTLAALEEALLILLLLFFAHLHTYS